MAETKKPAGTQDTDQTKSTAAATKTAAKKTTAARTKTAATAKAGTKTATEAPKATAAKKPAAKPAAAKAAEKPAAAKPAAAKKAPAAKPAAKAKAADAVATKEAAPAKATAAAKPAAAAAKKPAAKRTSTRPTKAQLAAAKEAADKVFAERLARHHDELRWLYMELYDNGDMFAELCDQMKRFYDERTPKLRALDAEREAAGAWYRASDMLGMQMYIDNFAGTIKGVEKKLNYIQQCNVNYIHLMPFLDTPADKSRSDGGYAVSDFRRVTPSSARWTTSRTSPISATIRASACAWTSS